MAGEMPTTNKLNCKSYQDGILHLHFKNNNYEKKIVKVSKFKNLSFIKTKNKFSHEVLVSFLSY